MIFKSEIIISINPTPITYVCPGDSIGPNKSSILLIGKNTNENIWTYEAGTGGGFGFVDHFLEIYYKKNKVQKIEHKRIQD